MAPPTPCPGYSPISSYAFLSDGRTGALVGVDGSVDWMCAPRFDGASLFARILDKARGGHFLLRPTGLRPRRRYVPGTNVLETVYAGATGRVSVWDFLSLDMEGPHGPGEVYAHGNLIRLIECHEGQVDVEAEIAPRPDYARARPILEPATHGVELRGGAQRLNLRADVPCELRGDVIRSRFRLVAGERAAFALRYTGAAPTRPITAELASEARDRTIRSWSQWSARCRHGGRFHEQVLRSVLVLKALIYHESGALLAAPSASLPEGLGGERNWDYRYMWFRDATLMLLAFFRLGYEHEAKDFMEFLLHTCRTCREELPVMVGIEGGHDLSEAELEHLEGYACSEPVRVGNGAHDQLQLDSYGEILDACWLYHKATGALSDEHWRFLRALVEFVSQNWRRPDHGIWEVRSERRHFTHSKVMSWVALDRGIRLAEELGHDAGLGRWRAVREQIHDDVMRHGFDEERGAFVQSYGSKALDASTLRLAHVGFIDGGDPRMVATIERVREELEVDGLVYRYRVEETDDGLRGGEGAFGICSFWLVSSLALAGRHGEAESLLERLFRYANDLGLYSEELTPDGQLLGNFPQAFTHLALIQAAANCSAAQEDADRLRSWARRESWL